MRGSLKLALLGLVILGAAGCSEGGTKATCKVQNGGCDPLTTCTETSTDTACSDCPSGYTGTGKTGCQDINECLTVDKACDPLTTCTNSPGSFTCSDCPSGYTGTGKAGCNDIDECATHHGGCDPLVTCTNTPGSFTCGNCPVGYAGLGDGGCQDIDECAAHNGGCDPLVSCTNTPGSFTCGNCPTGYTGLGDGGCQDIDECATNNGGCDPVTTCTNSTGSFSCGACPVGYTGTGSTGCSKILITIAAVNPSTTEPSTTSAFRISRGSVTAGDLTVHLAVASSSTMTSPGSASGIPVDYSLSGGSVTQSGSTITAVIPDGSNSVDVKVTLANNSHAEAAETLTLTLQSNASYFLGATTSATITAAAHGLGVITLKDAAAYPQAEGTLRQAMANGMDFGGGTISITPSGTIPLVGELPVIGANLVINGPAGGVTLDAQHNVRVVENRATTTFSHLNFVNGKAGSALIGGAILNRTTLTVSYCSFNGNDAAAGEAIQSFSADASVTPKLSIDHSSFTNNTGGNAAVENHNGTMTIGTSTFSNNAGANVAGTYTNAGGNTPANP